MNNGNNRNHPPILQEDQKDGLNSDHGASDIHFAPQEYQGTEISFLWLDAKRTCGAALPTHQTSPDQEITQNLSPVTVESRTPIPAQ